jgi:hypothetical protein
MDAAAVIVVEGLLLCASALFIGSILGNHILEALAVYLCWLLAILRVTAHLADLHKTGYEIATFIGGCIGLFVYFAIALVPSVVYGGAGGAALATLLGIEIDASLIPSTIVALGMLIGLLATCGLSVLIGVVSGRTLYSLGRNPALVELFLRFGAAD